MVSETSGGATEMRRASVIAQQLDMTEGALAQLRYTGKGPRFVRLSGRSIRYRQSDVDAWIKSRVLARTDERPAPKAG